MCAPPRLATVEAETAVGTSARREEECTSRRRDNSPAGRKISSALERAGPVRYPYTNWRNTMIETITRNWWLVALRGLAAILFGLIAVAYPGITLGALVVLFGVYAFVGGAFAIGASLMAAGTGRRFWPLLLDGILGIAAGVIAVVWPNVTALALLYLIAFWAIVAGIVQVV